MLFRKPLYNVLAAVVVMFSMACSCWGTTPTPVQQPVEQSAPAKATNVCEGVHDYQLKDLHELSADVEFIHVQYGRGGVEYETLLPAGRYLVKRPFVDGHVWELGPDCTPEQALQMHVGPSITNRTNEGVNTGGYVYWETLVKDGTLQVVWQKSPVETIPSSLDGIVTAVSSSSTDGGACHADHIKDSDKMSTITAPAGTTYSVETWGGDLGKSFVVIPAGQSVTRTWQGGAIFDYHCTNTTYVVSDVTGRDVPVYIVKNGELVKQ